MSKYFPAPETADEHGIVAIGGQLTVDWLLDAYSHGIFPWPLWEDESFPLTWFSLEPRAIIEFDDLHISKRLARTIRSQKYQVTCDLEFASVIKHCAEPRHEEDGVWITSNMIDAYIDLHHAGHAHSIEVWQDHELVGGIYGVAIGGLFAGESMFHRQRDASKVALVALIKHLQHCGFALFDIQQLTPHTESMGAKEISRAEYLSRLQPAIGLSASFGTELQGSQQSIIDSK
ncbi:MAG: leucyl/phenylalanyl-tRNA--protein transferase [Blastopirellula sp.]|nr:MAG: leucyl/phenylalanyl-tRNA--protein transferase [Blastopirellula sp.]